MRSSLRGSNRVRLATLFGFAKRRAASTARYPKGEPLHDERATPGSGGLASAQTDSTPAGIAHDFNNLLMMILGYCDVLEQDIDRGSPQARDLAEIRRAAASGVALTRQLLGALHQEIARGPLDVRVVVRDVSAMLQPLLGSSVALTTRMPNESCRVEADPVQIERMLLNLVLNARNAMSEGTIAIDVERVRRLGHETGTRGAIMVTVRDTGHGMDAATQERVFQTCFTSKRADGGNGLGLMIVRDIVRQLGGDIVVRSVERKGTTFAICLPEAPDAPTTPGRMSDTFSQVSA